MTIYIFVITIQKHRVDLYELALTALQQLDSIPFSSLLKEVSRKRLEIVVRWLGKEVGQLYPNLNPRNYTKLWHISIEIEFILLKH